MQLADSAQGENDLGEPAFHVENAGTTDGIAVYRKRTFVDRPYRPHRIEVPDQ